MLPHLNFDRGSESHFEMTLGVLTEDPLKSLLEEGSIETVSHHHVTSVKGWWDEMA